MNHFKTNRQQVQKAAIIDKFLRPVTESDSPYEITEDKNEERDGTLKIVRISNIPFKKDFPTSYILNMEIENSLFSKPERCKTVEKAILLFSTWSLYVILIEMKSKLKPYESGIAGIADKIKGSVGRISLFLANYIIDTEKFDDYEIKYYCLVLYNNDSINQDIINDPSLSNDDLIKIFLGKQSSFTMVDRLGGNYSIPVFFKKNPSNSEEFDVDLNVIFDGDDDFENAESSDKTLPLT